MPLFVAQADCFVLAGKPRLLSSTQKRHGEKMLLRAGREDVVGVPALASQREMRSH